MLTMRSLMVVGAMTPVPPFFAGHRSPEHMKLGPDFAKQKLAEAEAELLAASPPPLEREEGEDVEAFRIRVRVMRERYGIGIAAAVPSIKGRVALWSYIVAEHKKVPKKLRGQYPVRASQVGSIAPMRLPKETIEEFKERVSKLPDGGWVAYPYECWVAP